MEIHELDYNAFAHCANAIDTSILSEKFRFIKIKDNVAFGTNQHILNIGLLRRYYENGRYMVYAKRKSDIVLYKVMDNIANDYDPYVIVPQDQEDARQVFNYKCSDPLSLVKLNKLLPEHLCINPILMKRMKFSGELSFWIDGHLNPITFIADISELYSVIMPTHLKSIESFEGNF